MDMKSTVFFLSLNNISPKNPLRAPWTRFLSVIAVTLILAASASVLTAADKQPAEWGTTVAAAKQEGKVLVTGPRGQDKFQKAMMDNFQKKFGVTIDYTILGPEPVVKRVKDDRAAGRYPWDVFIGGGNTLFSNLKPLGALEPVESSLILPEVKGGANWKSGKLPFLDDDRFAVFFLYEAGQRTFVNTTIGQPEEITSYRDLLKPKWKGKILMNKDPRDKGSGHELFLLFYTNKDLGPEFVRALLKQDLMIPKTDEEADGWLSKGQFAICFVNNARANKLIKDGVPVKRLNPHMVKEGATVTTTFANLGFANQAPHPNAGKVLFNWLLSKEAGDIMTKATGLASPRADVSSAFVDAASVPDPSWPDLDRPDIQAKVAEMDKFIIGIMGKK